MLQRRRSVCRPCSNRCRWPCSSLDPAAGICIRQSQGARACSAQPPLPVLGGQARPFSPCSGPRIRRAARTAPKNGRWRARCATASSIIDEEIEVIRPTVHPRVLGELGAGAGCGRRHHRGGRDTFLDITQRRRARKSTGESEQRLRLLIESALDFAILSLDPNGQVISWNQWRGTAARLDRERDASVGPAELIFTPEDRITQVPAAGDPRRRSKRPRHR